ncbi:hypothetical protein EPN28_04055 [Patescibacteria group bacterium]|nr:MAG: hypothetical protein EPN28_04055 [Patescibacteria group bacterium]
MFYSLKLYSRDPWIFVPAVLLLAAQALIWFFLLTSIKPDSEQIFLHYNIIFGIDLVGDWWKIFYLPLAGLGALVLNYCLSFAFYGKDKFVARLLVGWAVFIHVFLLLAAILLSRLNG